MNLSWRETSTLLYGEKCLFPSFHMSYQFPIFLSVSIIVITKILKQDYNAVLGFLPIILPGLKIYGKVQELIAGGMWEAEEAS